MARTRDARGAHEANFRRTRRRSLVEGIAFALFGGDAFPRKVAGASFKAEHLVTDNAITGAVELEFSAATGRHFTVMKDERLRSVVVSG